MIFSSGTRGQGIGLKMSSGWVALRLGFFRSGVMGGQESLGSWREKIAVVNMGSGLIGKELKPRDS